MYPYENAKKNPDDFRRHKHCDCKVEYLQGDGRRQDVHTKAWSREPEHDIIKIESNLQVSMYKNFQNAISKAVKDRKLSPASQKNVVNAMREDSKKWIKNLEKREEIAIKKYTFNGIDDDGLKLYEKINGILTGRYIPTSEAEKNMIYSILADVETGIAKSSTKYDLVLYRKDTNPSNLEGDVSTVLSTSVKPEGVLGNKPNVAILAPKGTKGAYVDLLSKYPNQREFILHMDNHLKKIYDKEGFFIFEVKNNE